MIDFKTRCRWVFLSCFIVCSLIQRQQQYIAFSQQELFFSRLLLHYSQCVASLWTLLNHEEERKLTLVGIEDTSIVPQLSGRSAE